MKKTLFVYNEGFDPASNTYLKMIGKTAEERKVNVVVSNSLENLKASISGLSEEKDASFGVLIMQPFKEINMLDVKDFFKEIGLEHDIDNVTGLSPHKTPATAQGIFDTITMLYPYREDAIIGVIGRGIVGKALLSMLINYGYAVVEVNSVTLPTTRDKMLSNCNVIVGLSSEDGVLKDRNRKTITEPWQKTVFIDAGRNFDFSEKENVFKCGKWTRGVLFSRF